MLGPESKTEDSHRVTPSATNKNTKGSADQPRWRRLPKKWLIAGTLVVVPLVLYALRAPILSIPARFLVIDQDLQSADIIVVLNGGDGERAALGAELYHRRLAPRVVVARAEVTVAEQLGYEPNATDVIVGVLESSGVHHDSIAVIPFGSGATSTRDEAVAVRGYVEQNDVENLILVTTGFHTRRARWIFKKQLRDIQVELRVAAAPHQGFDETNWWKDERGLIYLNNEFIKLAFYLIRY